MKTAVSVPDQIYASAEMLAKQFGTSRSQLYTLALKNYLKQHSHEGVTKRLDAVYAGKPSELDPVLKRLQNRSLSREQW